jgi:hypothetical protein
MAKRGDLPATVKKRELAVPAMRAGRPGSGSLLFGR